MIQFKPLVVTDIDTIVTMMKAFYAIDNYPIDKEKSKTLFFSFSRGFSPSLAEFSAQAAPVINLSFQPKPRG